MWHDLVKRALPFARGAWTWTRVRTVLARLFMFVLLLVLQALVAAAVDVFAGKEDRVGHFFHAQVAYVAKRTATRRATGQLGSTVGADDVTRLTLKDGRQSVVEAYRTFKETDEILQRVDKIGLIGARVAHTASITTRICQTDGRRVGRKQAGRGGGIIEQMELMLKTHVVGM